MIREVLWQEHKTITILTWRELIVSLVVELLHSELLRLTFVMSKHFSGLIEIGIIVN